MTPERLVARCRQLGLRSLEWCHFPCHEPGRVDWDQVRLLDRLSRQAGIQSAVAGFAPLLSEGTERERMLAMVRTPRRPGSSWPWRPIWISGQWIFAIFSIILPHRISD